MGIDDSIWAENTKQTFKGFTEYSKLWIVSHNFVQCFDYLTMYTLLDTI